MNRPAASPLVWLVTDVFRQARATGLLATLLTVSAAATLLCLTISMTETADADRVDLALGFGAWRVVRSQPLSVAVGGVEFFLAGVVADTVGVLVTLMWTAGFLPGFLDPSAATVLLAKPASRSTLLVGKYLGVVAFVVVQAAIFVAGTGLALGLRTGVWNPAYAVCVPVLLVHFAVFFAFSVFLAVFTRNTTACMVGSVLFWLTCWGMNYGRHALLGLDLPGVTPEVTGLTDVLYWVLPKPADFGLILHDALQADRFLPRLHEFRAAQDKGLFHPVLSVASSLAFAGGTLALAVYQFVTTDY
jgi:ABC-2 family transporter protein